jgi:hypothetical protein
MRHCHQQPNQQDEGDSDEYLRRYAGMMMVVHLGSCLAADRAPALDDRARAMRAN